MRRKQTGLRLDPDLMERLRIAAERRGVGVSQEIRDRLWHSFFSGQPIVGRIEAAVRYVDAWKQQHHPKDDPAEGTIPEGTNWPPE